MAPTKPTAAEAKEAKLTPDQSTALMLDYLRKQNRPYSATDISANLKNRVTKAAAAKLLKDMHERKDIEGKAAGKQIVYHAVQDETDEVSVPELQAMDDETKQLRDATAALKGSEKDLRNALRSGSAQVSLPDLQASVTKLGNEKAEAVARLEKLRSGGLEPVSLEERESVNRDYKKWQKCSSARVKIRKEMWLIIESLIEKEKVEEVKESLGLEF